MTRFNISEYIHIYVDKNTHGHILHQLPMYALIESFIKLHDNSKYSHSCLNHLLILNMKIHVYSPTCSIKRQSSNVKSGPTRGKWLRQVQSLMIVCVSSVYVLETTSCRDKHCKTCHLSMK